MPQLALCVAGVVLVGVLGLGRLGGVGGGDPEAAPPPIGLQENAAGGGRVVVHVAGAVRRPGVYKLPAAARAYLRALEELAGCPLSIVSTGPDRDATIVLQDPWVR